MSGLVDKITKAVMGISAIVVFVITFLQVLCRFVLKSPLPWSTDILRLAFTYLVFWGAAWCVREKEHLNVDVLLMSFPVKIRKVVELGIDLVLSLFFIFMIVFGIKNGGDTGASGYFGLLYKAEAVSRRIWCADIQNQQG